MSRYPKIPSPYRRFTEGVNKNKLNPAQWATPEIGELAELGWRWTEKIDGTNLRVIWDGYSVTYGGRTDAARLSPTLVSHLHEKFPEELVEQRFGETPAVIFGEGCGKGIQKNGGRYGDQHFVMFDVRLMESGRWLDFEEIHETAEYFSVPVVPEWGVANIHDAITDMRTEGVRSLYAGDGSDAEGLVGTTLGGYRDRYGHRIAVKVKAEDFS